MDIKPGFQTSEFALSALVVLLTFLVHGHVLGDGSTSAKIVVSVLGFLAVGGYTLSRSVIKLRSLLFTDAAPAVVAVVAPPAPPPSTIASENGHA